MKTQSPSLSDHAVEPLSQPGRVSKGPGSVNHENAETLDTKLHFEIFLPQWVTKCCFWTYIYILTIQLCEVIM